MPFNENILGEYTATSDKLVFVCVNGKPASRDSELVDGDNVVVATGKSPEGQPVPIAWVQDALDLIVEDGEVAVNVETLRYRSAFIGAVLSTLHGAIATLRPATVRIRG